MDQLVTVAYDGYIALATADDRATVRVSGHGPQFVDSAISAPAAYRCLIETLLGYDAHSASAETNLKYPGKVREELCCLQYNALLAYFPGYRV